MKIWPQPEWAPAGMPPSRRSLCGALTGARRTVRQARVRGLPGREVPLRWHCTPPLGLPQWSEDWQLPRHGARPVLPLSPRPVTGGGRGGWGVRATPRSCQSFAPPRQARWGRAVGGCAAGSGQSFAPPRQARWGRRFARLNRYSLATPGARWQVLTSGQAIVVYERGRAFPDRLMQRAPAGPL